MDHLAEVTTYYTYLPNVLRDPVSQKEHLLDQLQIFLAYCSVSDLPSELHHSYAFMASKSDPNTLMYHEAMMAKEKGEFCEAMETEIEGLELQQAWSIVLYVCSRVPSFQANALSSANYWPFPLKKSKQYVRVSPNASLFFKILGPLLNEERALPFQNGFFY